MFRRLRRARQGSVDSKEHTVESPKKAGGSNESCSSFTRLDDEGRKTSASQIEKVDSTATDVEVALIQTRSLPLPPKSMEPPAVVATEQPDARSSSASFQQVQLEARNESQLGIDVLAFKDNQGSSDFLGRSRTQQSSITATWSPISSQQQQPSVDDPRASDDKGGIEMSTSTIIQGSAIGRSRTHQSSDTFADSSKQPQAPATRTRDDDDDVPQSMSTGTLAAITSVNESMGLGRSTGTDFASSESNLFRTPLSGTSPSLLGGIEVSSFSSILKSLTGNLLKQQDTSPVELTRQAAYEPPAIPETSPSSESTVAAQKSPLSPSLGGVEISPLLLWKSLTGNSHNEQDEVYLARKPAYEPPTITNGKSSESQVIGSLSNKSTHPSQGFKEDATPTASQEESGVVNVDNKDTGDDEIPSKVPLTDGWLGRLLSFNIGPYMLVVVFLAIFGGFLYSAAKEYGYYLNWANIFQKVDWDEELNVAFIGTAFLFVNDVSRVMESISDYHIHQMSVIHPGGSLGSLLATGNGMYQVWQTQEADIGEGYYENYGGYRSMYDFGACSVAQLLQGYDEYMDGANAYGVYYDDGLNPCLQDYIYENYVADKLVNESFKWDYVVLADQTKRMAIELARNDTVTVLANNYAPFLSDSGATPVVVGPHAFMSSKTNMTGLGTIPAFTALIHQGVDAYVEALANELPQSQAPVVCPVHLGFLLVWEEDYDFWQTLFVRDMMHSSLRGTYLFANILYATLFGHMPDGDVSMPEYIDSLFADVRKITGQYNSDLTREDAGYLRNIARRVVLDGEIPTSLDTYLY